MKEPETSDQLRAKSDKRVAANVKKYGCHVVSVFDPKGKTPSFSYSIGISSVSGAAEAIVVGVRPELGHAMISEYNEQIRNGVEFKRGRLYPGFLDEFCIYVEPAKPERCSLYTFGCDRFYKGEAYSVVQLIYPTITGIWPWNESATAWFKKHQPMLGRKHPNRP